MLTLSPGELWHEVEPKARERDGWVAFKPCPPCPTPLPKMAMRALLPGASTLANIAEHICTREDALEALSVLDAAALDLQRTSRSEHIYRRAVDAGLSATSLRATLRGRYGTGALISGSDAKRVGDIVGRVDFTIQLEQDAAGTVALSSASRAFYAAMERFVANPKCAPRPGRKWWLIPVLLIGTALVVHSETKDRRK